MDRLSRLNRLFTGTPFLILSGVLVLLTLGPIWLVRHDSWDGVIGAYGIARNDFSGIHNWLIPGNWVLAYLLLRALAWLDAVTGLPHWAWVKLLMCASVLGLARECRLLCGRLFAWEEQYCRAAQLLVLCFPCWYVLYGSTFIYLVFIWCVFAGHRLLHQGLSWPARTAGYLLLLLSFQVNSNFVMVCALEAACWLCRPVGKPGDPWASWASWASWNWWRSALVVGSAVVVYLASRLVWPPSGTYQGYNQLVWPFSRQGVLTWLRAMAQAATWAPLLLMPAAVAWLACRFGTRAAMEDAAPGPPRGVLLRQAATVALLVAGALFAYMAVGKGAPLFVIPLPHGWLGSGLHMGKVVQGWFVTVSYGWSARNAFLLSVPAALAMVWLLRWAGRNQAGQGLAVVFALAVNLGWLADGHGAKQLRAAQEIALMRGLGNQAPPPAGMVDLALREPVGWTASSYEVNYLLWRAYGRAQWAGALYGPDARSREWAQSKRQDALWEAAPASFALMDEIYAPRCHTRQAVQMPAGLSAWSVLAEAVGWKAIAAATVSAPETTCDQGLTARP